MAQAAFNKAGWLVVRCSDAQSTPAQPLSGWARHDGRHDGRQTKRHSRRSESAVRDIHAIDVDRDRRSLFRTPLPPRTNESVPLIEEFLRLLSITKHRASHPIEIIGRDEEHQLMRTPTAAVKRAQAETEGDELTHQAAGPDTEAKRPKRDQILRLKGERETRN